MGRTIPVVLLLVLAVVAPAIGAGGAAAQSTGCSFPITETDATGTPVAITADPTRVVALHPSAAQTMWEVGAREEVVGMPVNQYTAGLDGADRRTDVVGADGYTVSVEAVIALAPDLVLAPNVTRTDTVDTLRDAGLTVYHFRAANSIEDVVEKTRLTGRLTGNCAGAAERARWMRERVDRVRDAVAGEPRPTVVYPLGGGVVAGSGTFLHELITTAGGRNLAAEAGIEGYRQLSAEEIVARDPEWIVMNEGLPRSAIQLDAYNRTTAMREGQVVRVDPNEANQPAPRIVYPLEAMARALHPSAMAAVDRRTATRTVAGPESTQQPSTVTTTARETRAPGLPGFGVLAALLALAFALLSALGRAPSR